MTRKTLGQYFTELHHRRESDHQLHHIQSGPYLTLSRQYGCAGYELALALVKILDRQAEADLPWMIYNRGILKMLSGETEIRVEILEEERRSKPSMMASLLRSFSSERSMPGFEVRRHVALLIRRIAHGGRAIIIGQGGAGATQDLPNGLSVRLEAPEDWRIERVAIRQGIDRDSAAILVRTRDAARDYLRRLYESTHPGRSAFQLTYNSASFSNEQIAEHIVAMLKIKGIWPEPSC
ncbi:MAG: cytidylate kinase-like family protein [Deltaproteobacteria bacterium]|nr:cytidylate kinase-like family protein [Deltaproteobacteria bacterium]